jgi:uncharacterized protein (TIGR02466 family)
MTDAPGGRGGADALGALYLERYFPTLIYYRDLPDGVALNARFLEAIRAIRAEDEAGIERSNVPGLGGWHSRNDLNHRPAFAPLTDRIMATAAEISAQQGYDPGWELAIDNMWAIVNPPGAHNKSHIHSNVLWSGVYYVQAPENSGRIVFQDPRTAALMLLARRDTTRQAPPDQWSEVYFQPTPGRILMFPSWLYHSVEPNMAAGEGEAAERVIISFNLFQRATR